MGLFDKFKEATKSAVKSFTEIISDSKVQEQNKTASLPVQNEDAQIQTLPTLGLVTNYSGYDALLYDICLDDGKERIVVRKESDEGLYKYKFLFAHPYVLFNKFEYIKSENREFNEGESALMHYFRLTISKEYYIDFFVCCNFPKEETELSKAVVNYEKTKLFKLIYLFIDAISEEGTKAWVNKTCEFYNLLPIFDDTGDVHIDNATMNAANNRGFM